MNISKATLKDLPFLYQIGKSTPEFRVSADEEFMPQDEFSYAIKSPDSVFLVAKVGKEIAGFIYASAKDKERPFNDRYACLIYLVVLPQFRNHGIAHGLYKECEKRLKKMNINYLYTWACATSESILGFMQKEGFAKGHKYFWMDKKIK